MDYIYVGKIISSFGIKGEVKVFPETDFNRFDKGKEIFLKIANNFIKFKIKTSRLKDRIYIISFEGYDNINQILEYINKDIYIHESQREKLNDNENYYDEIIGLKVYNTKNELKGEVISILEVPQGHILEVMTTNGKKMVPYNNFFINEISDNKIIINEIEGLF